MEKEKIKLKIKVTNEFFEVNDLICDGSKLMYATPKLVNAQNHFNRVNWRKVLID